MRNSRVAVLGLVAVVACGAGAAGRGHAAALDLFLQERAAAHLPALDRRSGGGGGGGSDGEYASQYDRRLETSGAVGPDVHAGLVAALAADARAWLEERTLAIRSRGTTGDEQGTLERFTYRYQGDGVVGWVSIDGVRNERGGFTLLLTITEHVG